MAKDKILLESDECVVWTTEYNWFERQWNKVLEWWRKRNAIVVNINSSDHIKEVARKLESVVSAK